MHGTVRLVDRHGAVESVPRLPEPVHHPVRAVSDPVVVDQQCHGSRSCHNAGASVVRFPLVPLPILGFPNIEIVIPQLLGAGAWSDNADAQPVGKGRADPAWLSKLPVLRASLLTHHTRSQRCTLEICSDIVDSRDTFSTLLIEHPQSVRDQPHLGTVSRKLLGDFSGQGIDKIQNRRM